MVTPQNWNGTLRLEVEVPTTGLPNLVKNTSGAKGAWGWVTPVTSTLMTSSGSALTFKTTLSQAAYFTTEYMSVAAGKYVAARFDLSSITASHNVKVRFEWYDATKTLLSSSTQSAALSTTGTNYYSAIQAPASTAYVKFRMDLYNGVANPSANATITFNNAMVTYSDTAGAITTTRTNLVTNPSFETNSTGWSGADSGTIARDATLGSSGTASLGVTMSINQLGPPASAETTVVVTGGKYYAAQAKVRAKVTARTARLVAYWFNASGNAIGSDVSMVAVADSSTAWTTLSRVFTAPSAATTMTLRVQFFGLAQGETHVVDAVSVVNESTVGGYFDGATTATGFTYAWTGTAQASTSTETNTAGFGFSEPIYWQNVLGQAHEIQINTEELDVGTLSAELRDVALDPATASTLRPGRAVRVTALVAGVWEPIYTGTITDIDVDYPLLAKNAQKRASIKIQAANAIRQLASVSRSTGVATITDLPYVLEGAGVPWKINGSGNQVASANTVMVNNNASALDQIAVTRDSVLGYAWVDRQGVLTAIDRPTSGNLVPNGDFETSSTGWAVGANCTIARSTTAGGYTGTAALALTKSNTTLATMYAVTPSGVSGFAVTQGRVYTLTFRSRAGSTPRKVYGQITFYNSSGTTLSAQTGFAQSNAVGSWTLWTGSAATAPAGAAFASVTVYVGSVSSSDYAVSGEIHYFDAISVVQSADTPTAITETTYAADGLDLSFSTERVINEVTIKWLRYKAAKNLVQEVIYGPYRNDQSVSDWGSRAAEFTMQGATESSTTIAAAAQSILDANSVPTVRVNSVKMPIVVTNDQIPSTVLLELYSLVEVINTSKGIDETTRVVGVNHSITPTSWDMTLNFVTDGTVAAPQVTPSPVANTGNTSNAPQAGQVLVPITTVSTWTSVNVTFDPPFATVPTAVMVTHIPTSPPPGPALSVAASDITTTGCKIWARRETGSGTMNVGWVAVA